MNRRSVLAVIGGVGVSMGIGYYSFRTSGQEGRVFWRQMAVDTGGEPGSLIILTQFQTDAGGVNQTIHPDYEDEFPTGTHVSKKLHEQLQREYGSDEPYYLVRYEGHDCNSIPGDEGGDAVEVSRTEFNRVQIGDCVKY